MEGQSAVVTGSDFNSDDQNESNDDDDVYHGGNHDDGEGMEKSKSHSNSSELYQVNTKAIQKTQSGILTPQRTKSSM